MTLRNRGRPSGVAAVAGAVMAGAVRRANTADLASLARVPEGRDSRPGSSSG